jgi:hypothetical protein
MIIITRQTLREGTEQLVIVRHASAYHVCHIDADQRLTLLPDATFWTYSSAHTRLEQEYQHRTTGEPS